MSELKLKPCPMCGCRAEFDYGAPMNSGKRIVKVKCCIGCVEQNIFRCEEEDAAIAWNSRTQPEATKPAQDLSAAILEQAAQACDQQADGTNGAYRTACLQCANAVRELRDAAIQAQKDGHG